MKNSIVTFLVGILPFIANAQVYMTPNGYSGFGLIPNAAVIERGYAIVDHATAIPGLRNNTGHNNQIGFGLTSQLEFVGRLATQDLHCNMFRSGCPVGQTRDLSSSLKYRLPEFRPLKNLRFALGLVDVGGATSHFRSAYAVSTATFGAVDVTLGTAEKHGRYEILGKTFGGVTWNPVDWAKLGLQTNGAVESVHAGFTKRFDNGLGVSLTANRLLNPSRTVPTEWFSFALNVPLDGIRDVPTLNKSKGNRLIQKIDPSDLANQLERVGFSKPKINVESDEQIFVELENTGYQWNVLDAAGVSLGVIAGAYGDKSRIFNLTLTTRGISQLRLSGDLLCVKTWLQEGRPCDALEVSSGLVAHNPHSRRSEKSIKFDWRLRPEFVVSPLVLSTIGTERGALDMDAGINANVLIPLWTGAYWDLNRIEPIGMNTQDFEPGYPYYGLRIQPQVSRRMIHQVLNFPSFHSQIRVSHGMMHGKWEGTQLESQTMSGNGRHRFSLLGGDFKDRTRPRFERDYYLYSYRISLDDAQKTSTEITYGKFWNSDKGYQIGQRFWFGDTNIAVFLRRTKLKDSAPFASFAGVQISLPITPRANAGARYATVRGTNQWTYTLETRILEDTNPIGGGYGEIPNAGENLQRIFNRDRSGTDYFRSELWRIREAFITLAE